MESEATEFPPCKICGARAPLLGEVDFHAHLQTPLPPSGIPVPYYRCPACGFLFTPFCDDWSERDFAERIYNADYPQFDREYESVRSTGVAGFLDRLFEPGKDGMMVLDYGGGNGLLAAKLREFGFLRAETYDPFVPEFADPPPGLFDLVVCIEVLEHAADPRRVVQEWRTFMHPKSRVIFSTTLQPGTPNAPLLDWDYVTPRTGHVSIFSGASLCRLLESEGFLMEPVRGGNLEGVLFFARLAAARAAPAEKAAKK